MHTKIARDKLFNLVSVADTFKRLIKSGLKEGKGKQAVLYLMVGKKTDTCQFGNIS
jgi:hypothetical protein